MGQLETSHIVLGMMLIGLHRKIPPRSGLQEECFHKELTKKTDFNQRTILEASLAILEVS